MQGVYYVVPPFSNLLNLSPVGDESTVDNRVALVLGTRENEFRQGVADWRQGLSSEVS